MVLGDSLSAGYGLAQGQGWVALLQQRLKKNNLSYDVANASISGDTTRGALARLGPALDQHEPEIVIVELGGNDGLRGIQLSEMYNNLAAIVTRSRKAGARVLLVGMSLPPNFGPAYVKRFEDVYKRVAAAYGVALVPFLLEGVAEDRSLFQSDQIHPGPQAQPVMLDNVWQQLKPMLRQ